MLEVKSFSIFYPPNGLHYIFSKDFGHFWRQRGEESEDGTMDCGPLGHVKEGSTQNNRIWKVTTTGPSTEKLGPRVTLQSAQTLQGSESTEATDSSQRKHAAKTTLLENPPDLIAARRAEGSSNLAGIMSWILIGHGTKPFS